ncbi:homoserine O-acetyltransferase [Arthrobacter woluwensis]|uniref:homoserine O-acetyltransferase MetX n=1 Tax=Arthrobacter woluwensis TaxID=156980 RepID=UPI000D11E52F|nr:homoserine O-acetyltransferase [Arthrobacter woluwensis]PSS45797.1 homoserine O-acetyltransferase [Arthrobacter woluwensis]
MTIAASRPLSTARDTTTREERDAGARHGVQRTAVVGPLELEAGGKLPDVTLAYETWGTLAPDAGNAVLIQHALTGSAHVAQGDTDEEGWWDGLVGPGRAIDTDRFFVVAVNIIGGCNGSTGPSSPAPDGKPWGSRFPFITLRDAAVAEARLADQLGIPQWFAVVGGSMGGARALEWAAGFPERVRKCAVIAIGAHSTAEQIALAQAQTLAIRQDPAFRDGDYYDGPAPEAGLALARRIAHISYRSEAELEARFSRKPQEGESPLNASDLAERGRYQVESYLDHQGTKLVRRFDANSYIALTEALMSHDVGRGRGGVEAALADSPVEFFVAAVESDRLYLPRQSEALAAALPGDVTVHRIASEIGHDGFLTEADQLGALLGRTLFA